MGPTRSRGSSGRGEAQRAGADPAAGRHRRRLVRPAVIAWPCFVSGPFGLSRGRARPCCGGVDHRLPALGLDPDGGMVGTGRAGRRARAGRGRWSDSRGRRPLVDKTAPRRPPALMAPRGRIRRKRALPPASKRQRHPLAAASSRVRTRASSSASPRSSRSPAGAAWSTAGPRRRQREALTEIGGRRERSAAWRLAREGRTVMFVVADGRLAYSRRVVRGASARGDRTRRQRLAWSWRHAAHRCRAWLSVSRDFGDVLPERR